MSADQMVFWCTFFPTQQAFEKSECQFTVAGLAEKICGECAPTKDALPWLKLGLFGDERTDKHCLRSNTNLRWMSGMEFDYDLGAISFDDAVTALDDAGVMCICYTTASHTEAKPRWRILAPFSLGQQKDQRDRYLARLNGLFGGTVSNESWTLSQAFYFGSVGSTPTHQVEEVYGFCIDQLDNLDAGAIGKVKTSKTASGGFSVAGGDAEEDGELIRRIAEAESLHPTMCALAARYVARGMPPASIAETLRGLMATVPEASRDERWEHRRGQIPDLVSSAVAKFRSEKDARIRPLAKLALRLMREHRTPDEIRAAVYQAGEAAGIERDTVERLIQWAARKELKNIGARYAA